MRARDLILLGTVLMEIHLGETICQELARCYLLRVDRMLEVIMA